MRLFTILLVACGASPVEAPAPVVPNSTETRPTPEPLEVDIDALLGEDLEGAHFDHARLQAADASVTTQVLRQIFAVLETQLNGDALTELAERVTQSRIAWRYSDNTPVLATTAFEVEDVQGLDTLLARLLPEAEPLTALTGLRTSVGAVVRADETTLLVGNLSDMREMVNVGSPIEVTWPSSNPVITGWFASDVLDAGLTTLAGAAVELQRADFRLSFEGDVAEVHVDVDTSTIRVSIDRFTQLLTRNRNGFVMAMLRALDLETLFDNAELESTEDSVAFSLSLTARQAKILVRYTLGIFRRAHQTE